MLESADREGVLAWEYRLDFPDQPAPLDDLLNRFEIARR
jgi:hypothetical protein